MNISCKKLRAVFSLGSAFVFFFFAYKYFLSEEHKALLFQIAPKNHFISGLFLVLSFLISGFELRYVYHKSSFLKLSFYDTISIPFVINVWGYIIPLQGSFLYFMGYLKAKYGFSLKNNAYIYAFIFFINLSFFSLVGLFILPFSSFFSWAIFSILLLSFSLPLLIILSNSLLNKLLSKVQLLSKPLKAIIELVSNFSSLSQDPVLVANIIVFNLGITLINTLWSYWICLEFGFDIPFYILFLIGIVLKISMLFKITPGNLGVKQLANGGVFLLFGYEPSIGVFISVFQFVTLFLFSFPLGLIFSYINSKHFSLSKLRNIHK